MPPREAPTLFKTAREREARSEAIKELLQGVAIKPLEVDDGDAAEMDESGTSTVLAASPIAAHRTPRKAPAGTGTAHRPFAGGGAIVTSTGRPVVLSAGSRRLPAVFREQQSLTRGIDLALSDVQQTLKSLNYDFSKTKDTRVPTEMLQAVEADHQAYLNALDLQKKLGTSGASGGTGARRGRHGGQGDGTTSAGGLVDFSGNNSDNRHGCTERQWVQLVSQARDAAADEGYDDAQSVENYAAEPDVPRSLHGQTLRSLLVNAAEDCAKLARDLDMLTSLANSREAVWWESALLTRDVKSRTVRANYHARRAQRWIWRARESMLLQASYLNQFSDQNRKDLVRLQDQLAAFTQRVQNSEASTVALQKEFADLQIEARAAVNDRTRWQEELVDLAHARGLLDPDDEDPLRAEALLLLQQLRWSPEHSEHVVRAMQWLRDHAVLLDV